MSINFRDPADKIGAALGFIIGITLAVMMAISSPFAGLTLNGLTLPETPFIKIVTFLLVIGICVNLTRNLFVGAHDVFIILHKLNLHRKEKKQ